MQKLYVVTLKFATNQKINAIKMLREFFPNLGLAEAKKAVEELLGQKNPIDISGNYDEKIVNIVVTAEEYASYWIGVHPAMFGLCRVMNIQVFKQSTFFRPGTTL